ncbi:MAG: sel1 repeat family protein, partial [Oricola sp.]|nr:sel1 repeat family protein [Oricola sp.]
ALVYLMKDFVFKPAAQPARPAAQAERPITEPVNEGEETLTSIPDAPALNPQALYLESMDALGQAQTDAEAASAVRQLQDAAALGFPPAQLQLGELYKTGQGVEQDLGQARVWFRRAANGGNVLAMHHIGVMTARGDGGPADSQEAISWFEQAANFGLVDSQYNLGAIYHPSDEGGSSVQDAGKAYFWYSLAARNGDEQAQPLAAGVAVALSPDQRASIDAQVDAWTAKPADELDNAAAASL